MGKVLKGNANRKPPEPAGEGHAAVEAWIGTQMPRIQPVLRHIDGMIRKAIPGLRYAIKWSKAYYGTEKQGWIIELAGYHVSANVVFHGGPKMDPAPPMGEGSSRYVKVASIEEADTPEMRKWLKQAKTLPGWAAK